MKTITRSEFEAGCGQNGQVSTLHQEADRIAKLAPGATAEEVWTAAAVIITLLREIMRDAELDEDATIELESLFWALIATQVEEATDGMLPMLNLEWDPIAIPPDFAVPA